MGFFSELKSDLSQAVNTLMPDDKLEGANGLDKDKAAEETIKVSEVDIDSMLNRLDDIKLDDITNEETNTEEEAASEVITEEVVTPEEENTVNESESSFAEASEEKEEAETSVSSEIEELTEDLEEKIEEETQAEVEQEEPRSALEAINNEHIDEYIAKSNETDKSNNDGGNETMDFEQQTPTDETANITEGMVISGDLQTTGSLDLVGKIIGNVKALGKLNVTGEIQGDSDAAEIYAESARITGEVRSKGSVKVGQSTVIVGNIFGSSAVIAGAVKGDIDVHGPVVLDTTAIVMGNIKSQSVQINNGAVIEGMCSQAYADVNPSEFFEGLKNR